MIIVCAAAAVVLAAVLMFWGGEQKWQGKAARVMQEAADFWEARPLPLALDVFLSVGGQRMATRMGPGALSETTLTRPLVIGTPQAE